MWIIGIEYCIEFLVLGVCDIIEFLLIKLVVKIVIGGYIGDIDVVEIYGFFIY